MTQLISKFELDPVRDIKADLYQVDKKKLVIAIALISESKNFLLDEPFAALDVMTIKTLQEIIVGLQSLIIYLLFYVTIKQEIFEMC